MSYDTIHRLNDSLNGLVWGPAMLALIIGVGIYLSFGTGFIQVTKFGYMWKNTIASLFRADSGGTKGSENITPFQALTAALAGTAGVGNIAGVAGAIAKGGPGALFWMWVSAFFGMAVKYSEIVLALRYRQTDAEGKFYGGPMYYMEKGLGTKGLAVVFSLFGGLCCFGIGNAAQASEISAAIEALTGLDNGVMIGLLLAAITAAALLGGIRRISNVTSYLVPFMALLYAFAAIVILGSNLEKLPAAFGLIFRDAFNSGSAVNGIIGYLFADSARYGIARGVFSNEAGLGSSPIAHAAADAKGPVEQGLWGIFEVFADTIVMCTLTGLVVIISGLYAGELSGGALTAAAFDMLLPYGGAFVQVSIVLFALATILGWSYYGERCWGYLSNNSRAVSVAFKAVYAAVAFIGASANRALLVWDIADTLNGLMALPNLIALIFLSRTVFSLTRRREV